MTSDAAHVDILAIGAHPDDIELGCGGILAKLTRQEKNIVILDLTRGEMGTRGDAVQREKEACRAAEILGVSCRENAGLPDGGLSNTAAQQGAIIPFIRKYRPRILMVLMTPDRHPDHTAAHMLSRDANFFSGLKQIETGQEPWRAAHLYYYHPYTEFSGTPSCIVDISDTFELKMQSLRAYESQFHNPSFNGPPTFIATMEFWEGIEIRARFWGQRIGTKYGEPLYTDGPLRLDTLPGL